MPRESVADGLYQPHRRRRVVELTVSEGAGVAGAEYIRNSVLSGPESDS